MFHKTDREKLIKDAKEIKFKKGAILDKETVDKVLQKAKELSDDDLLLNMMEMFGRLVVMCHTEGQNVMGIYGLAAGYFMLENEALRRNLYF